MSNHPKHPAFVHFPITTTFLTGALDVAWAASTHPATAGIVVSTIKTLDIQLTPSTFPILSYYTTLLTLIFSIPAFMTGAAELMPLIKRDGISSKKAKAGILHAVVNDIAVFGAAYNWWTRRRLIGFQPDTTNVLISSALAVPATFFAAYLGGQLVYQYGMGVGRSPSRAKKTD